MHEAGDEVGARVRWWWRVRYSTAVVVAGWVCTLPGFLGSHAVDEDLWKRCVDSPGLPVYALVLAVVGVVLGVVGCCWGAGQIGFTLFRRRGRLQARAGHALLAVVVPLSLPALLVQGIAVHSTRQSLGPHRTYCVGAPREPGVTVVTAGARGLVGAGWAR
ncbi:hypothetical protein [Kitasatospora sp. NPDC088134]|uniref:hypothetical protein n=1 Tax=Kitasatospora sp. NPDC088134 TaxID=3364071 RepID=UPI003810CE41